MESRDTFVGGSNIWGAVDHHIDWKHERIMAAIAYVTVDTQIPFGEGDVLVCDAEPASIQAQRTDAKCLLRLFKQGTAIYSVPNLHAKVLVCGRHTVVGSANLSNHSATRMVEAALLTDRPGVRRQTLEFIQRQIDRRAPLTRAQLLVLDKLPKDPIPPSKQRSPRTPVQAADMPRVWLVRTNPLADTLRYRREQAEAKAKAKGRRLAPLDYIRFTGASPFRASAKEGDWVVQLFGARDNRVVQVYAPARIEARVDLAQSTHFYCDWGRSAGTLARVNKRLAELDVKPFARGALRELRPEEVRRLRKLWRRLPTV